MVNNATIEITLRHGDRVRQICQCPLVKTCSANSLPPLWLQAIACINACLLSSENEDFIQNIKYFIQENELENYVISVSAIVDQALWQFMMTSNEMILLPLVMTLMRVGVSYMII